MTSILAGPFKSYFQIIDLYNLYLHNPQEISNLYRVHILLFQIIPSHREIVYIFFKNSENVLNNP